MAFDCWRRNGKSIHSKSRDSHRTHSKASNIMERLCHYLRSSQYRHNAESHLYAAIKEVDNLELVSSNKWTEIEDETGEPTEDETGEPTKPSSAEHITAGHAAIKATKDVPYNGWYALDAVKARLQQLEMSVPQDVYARKSEGNKKPEQESAAANEKQSNCTGACPVLDQKHAPM